MAPTASLYVIYITLIGALLQAQEVFATSHQRSSASKFPGHRHKLKTCFKNYTYPPNDISAHSKCYSINHPQCLDIELPYRSVAIPDYVPDYYLSSIEEVQIQLRRWQNIRKLPKCWATFQVALCSIFMPQCEEDPISRRVTRVSKPSFDLCNDVVIREDCKFIERHFNWTAIFNCSDTNLYMKNCTDELRDPKLQLPNSECPHPLVFTNDSSLWFKDIEYCALSCKFPITDPRELSDINILIMFLCLIGILSTFTAFILFQTNGVDSCDKNLKIIRIIKRYNVLQLIYYVGWSLQAKKYITGEEVACGPNEVPLHEEPLVANSCVLPFMMTYLPEIYSTICFASLGKLCYLKLLGRGGKESGKNASSFGSFEWIAPVILCIIVSLLGPDANGLYGVCTAGQRSIVIKSIFVLFPITLGMSYGFFYISKTMWKLANVERRRPNITHHLIRIACLCSLSFLQVMTRIGIYIYESKNDQSWKTAIENYIACDINLRINPEDDGFRKECSLESKPIVAIYYLDLLATLSIGIVIASWAFRRENFSGLKQRLALMLYEEEEIKRRRIACMSATTYEEAKHNHVTDLSSANDSTISTNKIKLKRKKLLHRASSRLSIASTNLSNYLDWGRPKLATARNVVEDQRERNQFMLHNQNNHTQLPVLGCPPVLMDLEQKVIELTAIPIAKEYSERINLWFQSCQPAEREPDFIHDMEDLIRIEQRKSINI